MSIFFYLNDYLTVRAIEQKINKCYYSIIFHLIIFIIISWYPIIRMISWEEERPEKE